MNTIKPQDIEKTIRDFQYKYIELMAADGRKLAHYNPTPSKLPAKVKDIKELLNKQPDGLYYVNFKISPKGDIFQFMYNKGNVNLNEAAPAPVIINHSAPANLEKFQTLQEWKRQEQEISELKQKIAMLEMEKNLSNADESESEPEPSGLQGFAENILPMFMPIVDKYLSLKEREIKVTEAKASRPMVRKVAKFRPVPNLQYPNFGAYEAYFNKLTDNGAAVEMDYLEKANNEVYNYLNRKYYEATDEIQ